MSKNFSLLNMNGLSDVAIKLLDMIEKAVGWTVSPKGSKRDFEDALLYYKNSIMDDKTMPSLVKATKIAESRNNLQQYVNQGKIISCALDELELDASLSEINLDWLTYFFDYAKNIQDEMVQKIWARLLAEECNGSTAIQRKLIHVLSLMDSETALAFTNMCRVVIQIPTQGLAQSLSSRYLPHFIPLIVPFKQRAYILLSIRSERNDLNAMVSEYEDYCDNIPKPEQIAVMHELGLINILEETGKEFEYPFNVGRTTHRYEAVHTEKGEAHKLVETIEEDYCISYFDENYVVTLKKDNQQSSIRYGIIQFTSLGETLCKILKVEKIENFGHILHYFFNPQGFDIEEC